MKVRVEFADRHDAKLAAPSRDMEQLEDVHQVFSCSSFILHGAHRLEQVHNVTKLAVASRAFNVMVHFDGTRWISLIGIFSSSNFNFRDRLELKLSGSRRRFSIHHSIGDGTRASNNTRVHEVQLVLDALLNGKLHQR